MNADPLCRDCLIAGPSPNGRCAACGSPRLLVHPELGTLSIAHIDCDAFYAAIEKRDDSSLADKPLIVGGGKRGVVATACYIARTYGVHSAMPMFKALAACPNAIVIRPDMQKYARVGREVRALLFELTPLVEPLSIDEAFVDLTGTDRLHRASAAETLTRFACRVEQEIGISVSIGLSYCKFLAKIASDFDKPRGFSVLGRAEAKAFLADKPVRLIWGIGKVAETRLAKAGFRTIGDLQRRSEIEVMKLLGDEGRRLWRLANGIDDRGVNPERETKGISAETTFDADYADAQTLRPILFRLCERVAKRLKAADLAGRSVTLKLKSSDFRLRTRSRSGLPATQLASRLFDNADALLKPELDGTRYRLIGIGAGDLVDAAEADHGDLAGDTAIARVKSREAAVDTLREKFGAQAVVRGLALGGKGI
ncbi:MAG: DNA polymerase IV [Beijerinckiaceae bacterium]